jgi:hypothetical protein
MCPWCFSPDTYWDLFNVGTGAISLTGNLITGNWAGALVDAGGIATDFGAAAVPGVPGGAAATIQTSRAAAQLAENALKGAKGEAATAARLGDKVAGSQVTFRTSDGTKTRADFVTKDRGVVETKTGNAKLTGPQTKLQADVKAGREVTPVGKNAEKAGLEPGKGCKLSSFDVDRPSC